MKPKGLPEIDVPFYDLGDKPCRECRHSFFAADDTRFRYLRCDRTSQQCRYERHETGSCGEDALYWKERRDV